MIMSNGLIERFSGNGELVTPSQALATTEASRTQAEVQAQLMVAQARPRDQVQAVDRIMTSCQRQRLAEGASYQYSKGGSKITGPSVRLLECIAQNWGNIQFGFRELSQGGGESTVEAFAWDMETNAKRSLTFVVPHRMKSGRGFKQLTDPREIYEYVANQAQRRVRSCLEAVIPRDIVEDAVDECERTLVEKANVTPESIKKMVAAFENEFGVTRGQIEARIQRKLDAVAPAQFVGLRRIFNSLKEGMSEAKDWFKPEDAGGTQEAAKPKAAESTKDKLKAGKSEPPKPSEAFVDYERRLLASASAAEALGVASEIDGDERLTSDEMKSLTKIVKELTK